MIKISAPDGPFSLFITHKGYDIILFGLPDNNQMACDLKVFRDQIDVTNIFDDSGMITPNSENLYKIFRKIEEKDRRKRNKNRKKS